MRIICVAEAWPNYLKVKPVMDALEQGCTEVILVYTGQRYDAAVNDVLFIAGARG
jgi:UDP-N-acetylglucosamine 2-epimerase (non-hydrolysing)